MKGKEENGYALIITLLVIVIIFLFASMLMSSVLTSRKQFNKSEERIQMIDIAEMGVTHYATMIENEIDRINGQLKKEYPIESIKKDTMQQISNSYLNDFCTRLFKIDEISLLTKDVESFAYKVHKKAGDVQSCKNAISKNEPLVISFASTGSVNSSEKTIKGLVTISSQVSGPPIIEIGNSTGGNGTGAGDNKDWLMDLENKNGFLHVNKGVKPKEKDELIYYSNTSFNGEVKVNGGKVTVNRSAVFTNVFDENGGIFTIKGHALFEKMVDMAGNGQVLIFGNAKFINLKIAGNGLIKINGDAYFEGNVDLKNHKQHICVNGKVYIKGIEESTFPVCAGWNPESPGSGTNDGKVIYIYNLWEVSGETKVTYYQ